MHKCYDNYRVSPNRPDAQVSTAGLDWVRGRTHVLTAMARNFLQPSLTALAMAHLSAHMPRG